IFKEQNDAHQAAHGLADVELKEGLIWRGDHGHGEDNDRCGQRENDQHGMPPEPPVAPVNLFYADEFLGCGPLLQAPRSPIQLESLNGMMQHALTNLKRRRQPRSNLWWVCCLLL